jgi:hypothetical protein
LNRYPIWKYVVIAVAIAFGLIYTLPNFFGESPAVQVSSAKATVKIDTAVLGRVEQALSAEKIEQTGLQLEGTSIRVRLKDTDTQLKAKDVLARALNPDAADPVYVVALNLLSASPQWLTSMRALPSSPRARRLLMTRLIRRPVALIMALGGGARRRKGNALGSELVRSCSNSKPSSYSTRNLGRAAVPTRESTVPADHS